MKHLKRIAKRYKSLIAICLLMGIVSTLMQSFSAFYFQKVIDNFTEGTLTAGNIMIYGTVMITLFIINFLWNYPDRKLEEGMKISLKADALRKVSVVDYLAYVKLGTGALIQQIENGAVAGTKMILGFYLNIACDLLPKVAFSIIFIFLTSILLIFPKSRLYLTEICVKILCLMKILIRLFCWKLLMKPNLVSCTPS